MWFYNFVTGHWLVWVTVFLYEIISRQLKRYKNYRFVTTTILTVSILLLILSLAVPFDRLLLPAELVMLFSIKDLREHCRNSA